MGNGPLLIVGLDFGTTYNGIAWALQGCPDDIEVISTWPGSGNKKTPKVPTVISYDKQKSQWGYQTSSFGEVIRGVKLLLDETQETKYTPAIQSKEVLNKHDKKPLDVAGDYLQCLVAHAKEILSRRFGTAMKSMEYQFILTVPAVWPDKAKNSTFTAATQAGILALDVSLVSEPEAAALYCLNAIQPNSIENGDVVIVCDAGGGTVAWAICGSVLLDKRFENFLVALLGYNTYYSMPGKSREMAMKYWLENIKPNFAGGLDEDDEFTDADYFVPILGVDDIPRVGLEDGFLQMTTNQIKGIFGPVVHEVENLVEDQTVNIIKAEKKPKSILLVGGFGASEYLFRRLQSAYSNITVMQPPNAWSAVVRGAVQRGLDGNQVGKRIARCHYGIKHSTVYDSDRHHRSERYWDDLHEKWYVSDRMKWYIKKGDPISENEPIKMEWARHYSTKSAKQSLRSVETWLYVCNLDKPPDHKTGDVFKVCLLETDLSPIPRALSETRTNSHGEKYYDISYNLVMTPTSANLLFELEFNCVPYGSVQAKY